MAVIERDRPLEEFGHFRTLNLMLQGRSADDTEALEWCHKRVVVDGARSSSGLWCICLKEDAPPTVGSRGATGGDGMAALLCVRQDLMGAVSALPISWRSTERIYAAQGRQTEYSLKLASYLKGLNVREIDRWLEPRDPSHGRPRSTPLALYLMSRELGGARDTCEWPKRQPTPIRASLQLLKVAA